MTGDLGIDAAFGLGLQADSSKQRHIENLISDESTFESDSELRKLR